MMSPKRRLRDAAQRGFGVVRLCMPVPPPAECDLRSGASIRPASPAGARVDFSSLPRTRPTPTAPGTPTSRRCPFLGNPLAQRVVHASADHLAEEVNRSCVGTEREVQSALERLGVPSEREVRRRVA